MTINETTTDHGRPVAAAAVASALPPPTTRHPFLWPSLRTYRLRKIIWRRAPATESRRPTPKTLKILAPRTLHHCSGKVQPGTMFNLILQCGGTAKTIGFYRHRCCTLKLLTVSFPWFGWPAAPHEGGDRARPVPAGCATYRPHPPTTNRIELSTDQRCSALHNPWPLFRFGSFTDTHTLTAIRSTLYRPPHVFPALRARTTDFIFPFVVCVAPRLVSIFDFLFPIIIIVTGWTRHCAWRVVTNFSGFTKPRFRKPRFSL